MVNSIGNTGLPTVPQSLQGAGATARAKTEAEQKLDAVLTSLKAANGITAADLARRQIDQARVRLAGLTLAAGSAAAMGNGRMARSVADDIRGIAQQLSRTLNRATTPETKAAAAGSKPQEPQTAAQSAAAQIRASLGFDAGGGLPAGDLDSVKTEAGALADALKKVMKKLQLTGMNPLLASRERSQMQSAFGDASRELANLQKALSPASGDRINISA